MATEASCGLCREPCLKTQKIIQAAGRVFHDQCYICQQCLQPFPDGVFFVHEDRMYCEHDYWQLYGPRCSFCAVNIMGDCLTALGQKWHPHHFRCEVCDLDLVGTDFAKNSERPLCKPCHRELAKKMVKKPKCAQCNQDLGNTFLVVSGERMHPHHFNCAECKCVLDHLGREKEGKWYCPFHYDKVQALPICGGCRQPIEGRSFNALGREWHPEHFVCAKCETNFGGRSYHEYKGAPYCTGCFRSLLGEDCFICRKQVKGNDCVRALNKTWCKDHFSCLACDKNLGDPPRFVEWDQKPMCQVCYESLPRKILEQLKKQTDHEKKLQATKSTGKK